MQGRFTYKGFSAQNCPGYLNGKSYLQPVCYDPHGPVLYDPQPPGILDSHSNGVAVSIRKSRNLSLSCTRLCAKNLMLRNTGVTAFIVPLHSHVLDGSN